MYIYYILIYIYIYIYIYVCMYSFISVASTEQVTEYTLENVYTEEKFGVSEA